MIRLNVFIRTTESNRAEILSVAKELVTASLKDEGCIAYDIFESATRPDVLMICETWSDAKANAMRWKNEILTAFLCISSKRFYICTPVSG